MTLPDLSDLPDEMARMLLFIIRSGLAPPNGLVLRVIGILQLWLLI